MAEETDESGKGGGLTIGRLMAIILILLIAAIAALLYLTLEPEEEQEIIREGPPPLENPHYLDLGTFIINLEGGKYYLKTTLQLGFEEAGPKDWLARRTSIVKDLIITHLQTLSPREIKETKARFLLKKDLQGKLNSLFPNNNPWDDPAPIKRVLFKEFYQQ